MEITSKLVRALEKATPELFSFLDGDIKLAVEGIQFLHKGKQLKLTVFSRGMLTYPKVGTRAFTQNSIKVQIGVFPWRWSTSSLNRRQFISDFMATMTRCSRLRISPEHPKLQPLKDLVRFSAVELEAANKRHQSTLVMQSYPTDRSSWSSLKMSGIYSIRQQTTNAQYIGQSTQIRNRWQDHVNKLHQNRHHATLLQQDWNLYGPDTFQWLVIETVLPEKKQLLRRERYWMDAVEPEYNDPRWYARLKH